MYTIPKAEAIERLARAVEKASTEDLIEIYAELFPVAPRLDATGPKFAEIAVEMARHIRSEIEPEEMVDLWNVVFPAARNVYYDEIDDTLRYIERDLRYAEQ
jgi:exosome complex RNA-binding protein Rrp42 (RNase PH superfamily)